MLGGLPSAINVFRLLEARPGLLVVVMRILAHAPTLADELARSWRRQWPGLPDAMDEAAAYPAPTAEDLRRRALAPLAELGEGPAERLAETLRSWLLNQGRRDAVAAELFVHPQTVRYRMNQVRQLYGERLNDPGVVLELTVALGIPRAREA